MPSISISYWDLLKYFHFVETTEIGDRGWKEAQRQGYFTDNSIVFHTFLSLLSPHMLRVKHSPNACTHRFSVSQEVDTYFHNQSSNHEKMKLLCFTMQQCVAFQGVLTWNRPSWADSILHRWKLMKNYIGNVVG
jgi:hypothetical protein